MVVGVLLLEGLQHEGLSGLCYGHSGLCERSCQDDPSQSGGKVMLLLLLMWVVVVCWSVDFQYYYWAQLDGAGHEQWHGGGL